MGDYDCCAWQTDGLGQFRPLEGSNPFLGKANQTESVREVKLEMVCAQELWPKVVQALKNAHPYETPAFFGIPVLSE